MAQIEAPESCNLGTRTPCLFYKLIVASILQEKRLIPGKFINKYGDEICPIATLSVPSGLKWQVKLQKSNEKLWFQEGWQEFVDYHSVRAGFLMIFKYEGRSHFNVHIYDLTVSEINYSCGALGSLQQNHESQCLEPHKKDIDEIFGNDTSKERLCLGEKACDLGAELQSSHDISLQADDCELTNTSDNEPEQVGTQRAEGKCPDLKIAAEALTKRSRVVTTEDKERAVRAAQMHGTDNPFFRVIIRPSTVYKGFSLNIPVSFGRRYLSHWSSFITLQNSNGAKWAVRCVHNKYLSFSLWNQQSTFGLHAYKIKRLSGKANPEP
ncbi:hypothetical protein K2173_001187 [Erythroxylum novogranatense]|uniref:TF-B3 domain-containing protein n=1 Tax=Erythroxylum novogranatense TaxID=1862640 RepID=A0AAV8TIK0_9ROSI|nr:hypothetical protein K2173_001187 [Erythroxylum novogranatense]